MQVSRLQKNIRVSFTPTEKRLLLRSLLSIRTHYQIHPEDLDDAIANVWYSTKGCRTAGLSTEETRDWLTSLFQFRGRNLTLVESCIQSLQSAASSLTLDVTLDQAENFLTILNDHRLMQAAWHNLVDEELRLDPWQALKSLSKERLNALLEMELLGLIMEGVLHAMPNSGADWREHCQEE